MEDRLVLLILIFGIILAFGVYVKIHVLPMLRIAGFFIKSLWRLRASLRQSFDPRTHQGRWRLLGSVITVATTAALIFIFGPLRDAEDVSESNKIITLYLSLPLSGAAIYLATRCFWRAKRLDARPAFRPSAQDTRAPVIYLRSFTDDSKVYGRMEMTDLKFSTEEEIIAELVGVIGPLVAIGRPGEPLAYAGATRLYVEEADWQERVRTLLSQSKLVIVRAGDTPGLRWEIKECISIVRPERLLFLFSFSRRKYERFRRKAEEHFPCRLPEYTGRWIPNISIRAILFFDSTWIPTLVPLRQRGLSYWWRFFVKSQFISANDLIEPSEMRRTIESTLRPLLRRGLHQP